MFRSPTLGKSLAYDLKGGSKKPTWLFIHGLGDDMSYMAPLARQAEAEGYKVLRVDLFGHGETLRNQLAENGNVLPKAFPYQENVVALKELLQTLDVKDLVIVGHSYGGGISYALTRELTLNPGTQPIHVESVHMLAPYVQRIDKFMQGQFQSTDFLMNKTKETMNSMGMKNVPGANVMDPMMRVGMAVSSGIYSLWHSSMQAAKLEDALMDPALESYMRTSYRKHFVARLGKPEEQLTPTEKETVDQQVGAAILVTKGIRELDLLDPVRPLENLGVPVHVIGGATDTLVTPEYLQQFQKRLAQSQVPHWLEFVQGDGSGHFFPQVLPQEAYARIKKFHDYVTRSAAP